MGKIGQYLGDVTEDMFAPATELVGAIGSLAPAIQLGSTIYAALQSAGGIVQRFSFNPSVGFSYFLAPSTAYTLTVFDPTTLYVGTAIFDSAPSGSSTAIPLIGMDADIGMALADGLTTTAGYVIGVNTSISDNLVPGVTDLAALQEGLFNGSVLPSTTGVVATLPLMGSAQAVVLVGSTTNSAQQTAYVATGSYGLAIVDTSNYLAPTVRGQLQLSGAATDVGVDTNLQLAAVADGSGGLDIVDVSSPTSPMLIQRIAIDATVVQVFEGVAYANDGNSLDAVDLSTGELSQTLGLGGQPLPASPWMVPRFTSWIQAIDSRLLISAAASWRRMHRSFCPRVAVVCLSQTVWPTCRPITS